MLKFRQNPNIMDRIESIVYKQEFQIIFGCVCENHGIAL